MYQIFRHHSCVGQAEKIKEGCFYRFVCTCAPCEDGIHRIKLTDGEKELDLGICVPRDDVLYLTTRVPIKYLSGNELHFELIDGRIKRIPVGDCMTFAYLDKLESARLQNTNGQMFIVIDEFQDRLGSDQNQEYLNK